MDTVGLRWSHFRREPPGRLTKDNFRQGLLYLRQRDSHLAHVLAKHGSPPMWARQPGFPTLVHIILEQQVSLASAQAAYERLLAATHPLTPTRFLGLDAARLKRIGFSRQKTSYCRGLAQAVRDGSLRLERLARLNDDAVRAELVRIKGIGPWTADIYLLMALRRPDIWPSQDLALAVAVQKLKRLRVRPASDKLDEMSQAWRPWRAVAARILWHYYLSEPG